MDLEHLQRALGYRFSDRALLIQALTHRSFGRPNNERLEFLGDGVLDFVVAALLFERFERVPEGDLSRFRASLVRQQALFEIAQHLDVGACLRLGEGELRNGGAHRPSILADALEALFGAIYLDGGFEAARGTIAALYESSLSAIDPGTPGKDAKTRLQELLQARQLNLPVYSVLATRGAAHDQTFEVECAIAQLAIQVRGAGGSRRAAEQTAAARALEQLHPDPQGLRHSPLKVADAS